MINETFDYLTTADNWWGRNGLATLTWNHVRISIVVIVAAALVTLPPAVLLGHRRRGGFLAVTAVNLSRALPTFAVMALLFPISLSYGFGLGFWPTFVPLLLLALPPMFVNAYTGVATIDDEVVEAARAVGMTEREVLLGVEIPAAAPLIATGLRVSAVQVVATTTLGTYVGYRCLGTPIQIGIADNDTGQILGGALLVALLSLGTELGIGALARRLTPWTDKRRRTITHNADDSVGDGPAFSERN